MFSERIRARESAKPAKLCQVAFKHPAIYTHARESGGVIFLARAVQIDGKILSNLNSFRVPVRTYTEKNKAAVLIFRFCKSVCLDSAISACT